MQTTNNALKLLALSTVATLLLACGGASNMTEETEGQTGPEAEVEVDLVALKIMLGRDLFNDTALSEPAGQSCASCHKASAGFADSDSTHLTPVSEGAITGQFGNRNAPSAAYASLIPDFRYDSSTQEYSDGQFLDGRAANLTTQAQGPFLNPVEMANVDEHMLAEKLRLAPYADNFVLVYGQATLDDELLAFDAIADAIAAFESSSELNPFSSKFDAYLAGQAVLSTEESLGLDLFEGRALCTECHPIANEGPVLFSDFLYSNIGAPKNPNNPIYDSDPDFIDIGLAGNDRAGRNIANERGLFRTPTLRNVALTAPYLHNGSLATLEDVVHFYNTRDSRSCDFVTDGIAFENCWPVPEVETTMDIARMGDMLLTEDDEANLVAFLKVLSDGFFQ
ncbi:MAG: cytochrome c peroxidase [Flavobacteriales bacterium]|jgi:cytochrome c peroxidase